MPHPMLGIASLVIVFAFASCGENLLRVQSAKKEDAALLSQSEAARIHY
jgi:hypothetical protein